MASIAQTVSSLIPAGMTLAQWLASQNSLNNATNTVQQGATTAATGLNTAAAGATAEQKAALEAQKQIAVASQQNTGTAATAAQAATAEGANTATIAQQEALAKQQGLYQTTVDANAPYAQFGTESLKQLQNLQSNPESITSTPGYQFELSQGLKGGQRAAAASGT